MCPVWLLERDNSRHFWSSFPFSCPQVEQLHVLSNSLSPAQMQVHFCHYSHFQTLFSAHFIPLKKGHKKPNQDCELLSQLPKPRQITAVTAQIYFRTGRRSKPLIPDCPGHHCQPCRDLLSSPNAPSAISPAVSRSQWNIFPQIHPPTSSHPSRGARGLSPLMWCQL